MHTIYRLTSPSGKVYIGYTSRSMRQRLNDHRAAAKRKISIIHKAITKYPLDSWKVEVLLETNDRDLAFVTEIRMIEQHDSTNPDHGYNHSTGGELGPTGCVRSPETRALIGAANKGRAKPVGWGANHSEMLKGRPRPQSQKDAVSKALAKTYTVTYPCGKIETVTNLRAFCKLHRLSQGSITTTGKTKGYTATLS